MFLYYANEESGDVIGKVKSAYGPMWPTRPELIPVSVA